MLPAPSLAQKLRVPRILWGALLASQGIYAGLLAAGVFHPDGPHEPLMLPALIGAAVVTAIASFAIPVILWRGALAQIAIEVREVPDPEAPIGFRGAAPTIRAYEDPARVVTRAFALGMTPFILSLALSEAISVFGFVLGVTGHPPPVWVGFITCGMVLTALRFPTADTFLGPIEKHTGVRLPR